MVRPWAAKFRILIAGSLAFGAISCAGPSIKSRNMAYTPSSREQAAQVLNQPFSDLNLSGTEVPPLLARIARAPYARPAQSGCLGIEAEIDGISRVLGPDLDLGHPDSHGHFLDTKSVGEAAWGTARGAADGWMPFHGVIRVFSGAARHDRLVEHAILAGFVRRAYLKGLREAQACPSTVQTEFWSVRAR